MTDAERLAACRERTSKSPSHVEELRSAILDVIEVAGPRLTEPDRHALLGSVERYDRFKRRDRA